MPAKQHLNFHGTVSTFVCRLHPSLTGAPACVESANAFSSSNRAFDNEREINADKKGRVRRQGVLNSCDTVSCRKVSFVLVDDLRSKSGKSNRVPSSL